QELRGGRVDRPDERDQLSSRAHPPAAAVLEHAQDRRAEFRAGVGDELERTGEGRFDKVLGVLDRRRLGRGDDESASGKQEEVEDVERTARAEIEHDVVNIETLDVAEE